MLVPSPAHQIPVQILLSTWAGHFLHVSLDPGPDLAASHPLPHCAPVLSLSP